MVSLRVPAREASQVSWGSAAASVSQAAPPGFREQPSVPVGCWSSYSFQASWRWG